MPEPSRQLWSILTVAIVLTPLAASAQAPASSFEELRQVLKNGQRVVVTDTRGHQTTGDVVRGSPTDQSITILAPEPRRFTADIVAEVRTSDRLLNGALIGSAVGTCLAVWDYAVDPSEPGNAAIFALAIGLGTGIGTGIDALIESRLLYRRQRQSSTLNVSPLVSRNRRGVLVSVRF